MKLFAVHQLKPTYFIEKTHDMSQTLVTEAKPLCSFSLILSLPSVLLVKKHKPVF